MKHIEERKCMSIKIDTWEKATILKGKLHMKSLDDVMFTALNILELVHDCANIYKYDNYLEFTRSLINIYTDYENNKFVKRRSGL